MTESDDRDNKTSEGDSRSSHQGIRDQNGGRASGIFKGLEDMRGKGHPAWINYRWPC